MLNISGLLVVKGWLIIFLEIYTNDTYINKKTEILESIFLASIVIKYFRKR